MVDERLEIRGVKGCNLGTAPNRHRRDHATRELRVRRPRALTPGFTPRVHPRRCCPGFELEVLLQRIQGLQRGEPRLAVLIRLENREQTATLFRQPSGVFGDHASPINLNLPG